MSAAMYVFGAAVGLAFGSLVAYLNSLITKNYLRKYQNKQEPGGIATVMGLNLARQLINIAALAIVFFTRKIFPFPYAATLIGTALGLTAFSLLLISKITKNSAQ